MQQAQSHRNAEVSPVYAADVQPGGARGQRVQDSAALHVVVLNWNLTADTLACVESLLADGFAPSDIVVVDNGSTAGRAALAQDLPAGVGQIYLPHNLGFAAGNNVGIAAALDGDAAWVLLLNNDTLVAPGTRAVLLDVAADGQFALLSPLILYADGPPRIWSLGDRRLLGTLLTRGLWRNQPPPAHLPPLVAVDFLTACALMVRADVFAHVGLLDAGYFMYAEDADFCLRAANAGYGLACATQARIAHKVSRSTGTTHPASRRWRLEYQARFYRMHGSVAERWLLLLPYTLARALFLAVRDLVAGRGQTAAATLAGWLHGWFDVATPHYAAAPSAQRND
jgi:GT2 family glycosyltransferase